MVKLQKRKIQELDMPTQTIGHIGHFIHLALIFQDTEPYLHSYRRDQ